MTPVNHSTVQVLAGEVHGISLGSADYAIAFGAQAGVGVAVVVLDGGPASPIAAPADRGCASLAMSHPIVGRFPSEDGGELTQLQGYASRAVKLTGRTLTSKTVRGLGSRTEGPTVESTPEKELTQGMSIRDKFVRSFEWAMEQWNNPSADSVQASNEFELFNWSLRSHDTWTLHPGEPIYGYGGDIPSQSVVVLFVSPDNGYIHERGAISEALGGVSQSNPDATQPQNVPSMSGYVPGLASEVAAGRWYWRRRGCIISPAIFQARDLNRPPS
jgi:hypothetical protein